ncbi:MAG: hypothetical protein FWD49_05470 [Firmicutes bacterium]|nr:hypothetical protein [Bacillota bacterium]
MGEKFLKDIKRITGDKKYTVFEAVTDTVEAVKPYALPIVKIVTAANAVATGSTTIDMFAPGRFSGAADAVIGAAKYAGIAHGAKQAKNYSTGGQNMSSQVKANSEAILQIKAAIEQYQKQMAEAIVNYNGRIQEQGRDWNDNDFSALATTNPLLDKMGEITNECIKFENRLEKKAEIIEKMNKFKI